MKNLKSLLMLVVVLTLSTTAAEAQVISKSDFAEGMEAVLKRQYPGIKAAVTYTGIKLTIPVSAFAEDADITPREAKEIIRSMEFKAYMQKIMAASFDRTFNASMKSGMKNSGIYDIRIYIGEVLVASYDF